MKIPFLSRRSARTAALPANDLFVAVLGSDNQLYGLKATALELSNLAATDGSTIRADPEGFATAYAASDWAFRCLNLRATKVAELLSSAKLRDNATDAVVYQHPYLDALKRAYRDYHQHFYFCYAIQRDIFGEVYFEKIYGRTFGVGLPRVPWGARVLPTLAVQPEIVGGKIEGFWYTSELEQRFLSPTFVIYDYVYNPFDELRGLSPLAGALNAVNLDMHIIRHNIAYFRNGARPSLVISPKQGEVFGEKDYETVRARLQALRGVNSFFKPLPLSRPVDITMVEYPSLEDQKVLTDDQRARICARLGVPEGLLYMGQQAISPEHRILFHENTVIPLAKELCQFINANLLPFFDPSEAVRLELDERELAALVEDEVKRDEIVRARYLNGQISYYEMRAALRLKPKEGPDFYMLPIGHRMVSVEQLGAVIDEQTKPLLEGQLLVQPPALLQAGEEEDVNGRRRHEYHPPTLPSFPDLSGNGESARRELRAWRRVALRKGKHKALDFVADHLPPLFAHELRLNLQITPDTQDDLADLFRRSAVWLAAYEGMYDYPEGKAIQATRLEFEETFEAALQEALHGNLTRRRWATIVRALIRRWGIRAFRDGLEDGGVSSEALSPEDQATINAMLAQQSEYVTRLGERLFSAEGIEDAEAVNKAEAWFNKSIMPFYHAGRLSADKDGLYQWQIGQTEEHCQTCLLADGQKHRLSAWHRRGLIPQSDLLECRGFNCQCRLVRTTGRPSGDLDAVPLLREEH